MSVRGLATLTCQEFVELVTDLLSGDSRAGLVAGNKHVKHKARQRSADRNIFRLRFHHARRRHCVGIRIV